MAPSSLLLLLLDPLYCQEDNAELDDLPDETATTTTTTTALALAPPSTQSDPAEEDLPELFASLRAKERRGGGAGGGPAAAAAARAEVAGWAARAAERQGFSALTALLAVDYLDRCFFGVGGGGGGVMAARGGRGERPWMGRLAAVACLALAAKVEETQVPLLLDLQLGSVEEEELEEEEEEGGRECCRYLFEARTVRRMELLVLSALSWRMNPVTPLSYIHPLLPFFSPKTSAAAARLRRCEAVLVSIATDWRWVSYSPSVWAAAVLLYTSEEYGETHRLVALLNAPKNEVQECYQLILEQNGGDGNGRKRKKLHALFSNHSAPPSPTGVVGSCFSCETSSTSGAGDYSVSSSPEPPPRKRPNCIAAEEDGDGE
ncbi:Cyclin-D3-2 [Ananas comosus]|uniref:Cyclin-D3-2 n=2 Tax=Ananas comosus TaxID=4615 RepID=A0A199UEF2_ANACO|nr:Cyclin-D3-2 [Ananas comosus]